VVFWHTGGVPVVFAERYSAAVRDPVTRLS
jgi:hypothetical protein